jgi:hypothetical protein
MALLLRLRLRGPGLGGDEIDTLTTDEGVTLTTDEGVALTPG